jgi:hypothetical protein
MYNNIYTISKMIPGGRSVPAFTVLEDSLDITESRNLNKPLWMSMYDNATLSQRPQQAQFPSLNNSYDGQPTFNPSISQRYNEMIEENAQGQHLLDRQGLPSIPPRHLEDPISLPDFNPPYGTPYPTKGYSFWDASASVDSGQTQGIARPPVPLASIPALIDARNSPSVPLDPATLESYKEYANQHFREGFRLGTEQRSNCPDIVHHLSSCSLCKTVVRNQEKLMLCAIGFLVVIVIILLILLMKKKSA